MAESILVSACLLGLSCRYDARKYKIPDSVRDLMDRDVCLVPVCPEQLGGLPTPRPKNRLTWTGDTPTVINENGRNVTAEFARGAEESLRIARLNLAGRALFKSRSPSCGEQGVATRLLRDNGVEVRIVDAEKE